MNYQFTKVSDIYRHALKKWVLLLPVVSIALMFWGCGSNEQTTIDTTETIDPVAETPEAPDYQIDSCWVSQASTPDRLVDVFYVYPTIYNGDSPTNMDINDASLRTAAEYQIVSQAGVYSTSANVFAPYYRQMSMTQLDPETDMYQNQYFQLGYSDISRAFEYYLENLNDGRPFILAGHSQGSMLLIQLMRDYFDEPELQNQLVAAYLIGYSITPEDFTSYPWMKPATRANDTGVIISYNTQAPGATGSPVLLPGAFCINPLNWSTDETPADSLSNLGAVFFDHTTLEIDREIPHYAGAHVDLETGALVTTLPEELDLGSFPQGVYHVYDYAIWYRNLEANVSVRCSSYLDSNE